MFNDHMLPMLQIQDKKTSEIVTQVFNFIDSMGTLEKLTVEAIEAFLQQRGILEPAATFADEKQKENYLLANEGSFLNEKRQKNLNEQVNKLNEQLVANTEQKIDIEYDSATINYKKEILHGFRLTNDPYNLEIGAGEFDYEQNPAEPTKPTKKVVITNYEPIF